MSEPTAKRGAVVLGGTLATSPLERELERLDGPLRARLAAHGFDAPRLAHLAATLTETSASPEERRRKRNRVQGEVQAPREDEIFSRPASGSPEAARLLAMGEAAMRRGELAFCVMAGGMATRMGGVVKALVEALPGKTFLDLRLAENRAASARAGRPLPLWLMTSDATDEPIRRALRDVDAPPHVTTFQQDLSLRLSPDGTLFRDERGAPSTYAPGHGDLVDALRRSGLLAPFRKAGGKYVWIANLDNLGASVDPVLLGTFLASTPDLMVEVVDKVQGDKGGIPVHAEGRLQVLEEFRLPDGFDPTSVTVFNTNTFLARADALESVDVPWSWFEVEKKVDGRSAIQFERLLQELTFSLTAIYVRVPRDGMDSRFLPVKDPDELSRRRVEIERAARARGMLG